jgi:hypothetical protein
VRIREVRTTKVWKAAHPAQFRAQEQRVIKRRQQVMALLKAVETRALRGASRGQNAKAPLVTHAALFVTLWRLRARSAL